MLSYRRNIFLTQEQNDLIFYFHFLLKVLSLPTYFLTYSEVPIKRPPMVLVESGLNSEQVS